MTTTQQISRAMYFAGLRSGIREAMDDLNGVRRALIDSAYLPGRTPDLTAATHTIETATTQLYPLLRKARDLLKSAADSFRGIEGKDTTTIAAPEAVMGQRFAGSWRGVIADANQSTLHDRRVTFDGIAYQAWADRFGPPNSSTGTEWVLRTPAGPATIYASHTDTDTSVPITEVTAWHIGGHSDVVVAHLDHALMPDIPFTQHNFTPASHGPNGGLNVYSELTHWLTEATLELRDVQAWMTSDWTPAGIALHPTTTNARNTITDLLHQGQTLATDARATAQSALETYCATATTPH